MATAPKLSAFSEAAEAALRLRDIYVGQPKRRREMIAALEAGGMTSDELRLVMRWWDCREDRSNAGLLVHILGDEEGWRDVVEAQRTRDAESATPKPYPGMPRDRYDPNPLIREMRKRPPFSEQDAVEAFEAGHGRNLWSLACHLGWTDDAERHAALRDGVEPDGVGRLRGVLRAAGIETAPWAGLEPRAPQKGRGRLRRVK